jgi:hypothetical protein
LSTSHRVRSGQRAEGNWSPAASGPAASGQRSLPNELSFLQPKPGGRMRQGARWPGCPPLAARAAHSRRPSPQSANHSWWAGGRGDAMRVRHTRACCQSPVRPGLLVPGFFRPQGCAVPTTSGTSVSPPHGLCPVTHSDWVWACQRMSDSLAKLPLLVVQGHAKPKSTPLPSLHALIRSNPCATTCPAESMSSAPGFDPLP